MRAKRLLALTAIAIIAILATSLILYRLYATTPAKPDNHLEDAENDVTLNIGTKYPGMIDITNALLEANGTSLKITINVTDPFSDLSIGEYAQWNATIILENEVPTMYEICAELNSTRLSSYTAEIGENETRACQAHYYGNSLTLNTLIDELPTTKQIQWFILTTYERSSADELITSASDIAPDEGLHQTVLKE